MNEIRTDNPTQMYNTGDFPRQQQPPPGLQMDMTPRPDCGEDSYFGTNQLAGKKALITGGDSGLGRAAAIAFAREGADVALAYVQAEEPDAREVQGYIEDAGQKAVLLPGDLRDEAYNRDMVDFAAKAMGGLDILVLNAGRQVHVDDIRDMSMDVVREVFEVNIISLYATVQQAMPYLNPGASIITTASVQAYEPSPGLLDYAPTKAAIAQFSRGLALQLAPKGIRVNSVAPGPIWTALQVVGGQLPQDVPQFGQSSPLGRAGQPVECAPVYVFLASDRASYVTGQVYGVTGGILTN